MKNSKDKFIQIRIDKDLKEKYIELCKKHGYDISKRIRIFIEKEINDSSLERINLNH